MVIGNLPDGWEWKTVDDLAEDIQYGYTQSADHKRVGPKFLRITDIQNGMVDWNSVPFCECSEQDFPKYKLEAGDIVFARTGATTGKSFLIHDCPEAVFASYLIRLRLKPDVNIKYFYNFLQSSDYWAQITTVKKGSAQPGVNATVLKTLQLPVAPFSEQEQIVNRIEELLSDLDAGVATLERVRAGLKRYRASVLKAACDGKLLEIKEVQNGELPEGWQWAKVEELAKVGTGATPLRSETKYWNGGNIPWITSGALNDLVVYEAKEFITELAVKETNAKVFSAGALLVAMYGEGKTRGKVSELMIDAATNQACAVLVFKGEMVEHKPYVKLFFEKNYEDIRRLSSGGVQPNLNLSIIKNTRIPLPPLEEQRRIVAEVERRLSVVGEVESAVEAGLVRAGRLRQAVLRSAFEGRL